MAFEAFLTLVIIDNTIIFKLVGDNINIFLLNKYSDGY